MKVLLSCGGTGGHIFPAIAIAQALRARDPKVSLYLAGQKGGLEEEAALKADIPFVPVKAMRIAGSSLPGKARSLATLIRSGFSMRSWIKKNTPDFLICTGGFVTGAPILGAILSGTPYFLHEQNVYPGLSNRQFASRARKVFISYEETKKYLRGKGDPFVLSGNPVRSVFFELDREALREKYGLSGQLLLLSSGGSLGSDSFNDLVLSANELLEKHANLRWVHTYGPDITPQMLEKYESMERFSAYPFIEDMPQMVTAADLVLSRAGAITLSENAFTGRAAVLLPSPFVPDDHQKGNARAFAQSGAASVFEDADLYDPATRKAIYAALDALLSDEEKRRAMGEKARELAREEAADLIARTCMEEVGR